MNSIELRIIEIYNEMLGESEGGKNNCQSQSVLHAPLKDLSLDSLEFMDLVMQIEVSFNIFLDESEVLKIAERMLDNGK